MNYQHKIQELENEKRNLESVIDKYQSQISILKGNVDHEILQNENLDDLKQELERVNEEHDKKLESIRSEYERSYDELRKTTEAEKNLLKAKLEKSNATLTKYQQELTAANGKISEQQDVSEDKIRSLNVANADMKKKYDADLKKLGKERDDALAKCQQLEQDIRSLQEEVHSLKGHNEKEAFLIDENSKLKIMVEELTYFLLSFESTLSFIGFLLVNVSMIMKLLTIFK